MEDVVRTRGLTGQPLVKGEQLSFDSAVTQTLKQTVPLHMSKSETTPGNVCFGLSTD